MDPEVELITGGDFNRHNAYWGGNKVANTQRQGEGEPIIDFIILYGLRAYYRGEL